MTYPPKIKKSRRGLLHDNLGIPRGQKIGEQRLERAAHSSSPSMRREAQFARNFNEHGHHGVVTSIHDHGKKFVRVDVTHGRRARRQKAPDGTLMPSPSFDDRPTSSVVVPRSKASLYRIGQRVGVGVAPLSRDALDDQDADDASASGADTDEQADALQGYHQTMRRILTGNPIGSTGKRKGLSKKGRRSGGR